MYIDREIVEMELINSSARLVLKYLGGYLDVYYSTFDKDKGFGICDEPETPA